MSQLPPPPPPSSFALRAVLDAPIRLMQTHAGVLVPWVLAIEGIAVLPNLVQVFYLHFNPMDLSDGGFPFLQLAVVYGVVGVMWLVRLACLLALYRLVQRVLDHQEVTADDLVAVGLSPSRYGTFLLKGVAVWAGAMLCFLPGVFLGAVLALVAPVLVAEDLRGTRAMGRSYDLVARGAAGVFQSPFLWAVVLAGVVFWLVSFALNGLVTLPSGAWMWSEIYRNASSGVTSPGAVPVQPLWLSLTLSVLAVVVRGLPDLYLAGALTFIYRQSRAAQEGADLEQALKARLAGQ